MTFLLTLLIIQCIFHINVSALSSTNTLSGLDVAVVGGGPSGLLCAHRLLGAGCNKVTLYEGRGDPRLPENVDDDRAYALGVGIRGRSAIKTVDDELWDAVKSRGFPCDKFVLHPTPSLALTLRDDQTSAIADGAEPSVLLFQSDLCSVLLDELENRYGESNRLNLKFNSKVEGVKMIDTKEDMKKSFDGEQYDLVVGCDGVRSKVRDSMESYSPNSIKTSIRGLPGVAKVRLCKRYL